MKALRLARKTITILVKDRLHYPDRLVLDTFTTLARCGVLLLLYAYVFKLRSGVINGTTFQVAAWSMFFYFLFLNLRLRGIATLIMKDVQTGTVEVLFSKPISYLAHRMWWQVGSGLYSFLVIGIVAATILALLIGFSETMQLAVFVPTFLLTAFLGCFLLLLVYLLLGLLSFWIEDINPLFWIVDKSVMILGGSYLPVALFPPFLASLALYSPFGATQFVTHTVYGSWAEDWLTLVGFQIAWILGFGVLCLALFALSWRRVSV